MADMFGGPVGESHYLADRARGIATAVKAEETLGLLPAQRRLLEAKAAELEFGVQQDKLGAEALIAAATGGVSPGAGEPAEPQSMPSLFRRAALGAAQRGLTVQAQKLAASAALIDSREASAASSMASARLNQIKAIREDAETQGQFFGQAQDEEAWQLAGQMYTFQTGRPNPYANIPFDPAIVAQIQKNSLSIKEAADLEEKKLSRLENTEYRRRRLGQHEENLRIRRAEKAIAEARERRLEREGGGSRAAVGRPTPDEQRQVKRIFEEEGIKWDKINNANQVAYDIASRARELQGANRALGSGEALRQAFDEAKEQGALQVVEVDSGSMLTPNKKNFRGKTKPIGGALPASARSALKAGFETTFKTPTGEQTWTLENGQPKRVR